jgi:hypothetical protein
MDKQVFLDLEKRWGAWAVFLLAPAVITVFLLVGLAMWTDELITIELEKTERGLGFSILDYQDPLNPQVRARIFLRLVQKAYCPCSASVSTFPILPYTITYLLLRK